VTLGGDFMRKNNFLVERNAIIMNFGRAIKYMILS